MLSPLVYARTPVRKLCALKRRSLQKNICVRPVATDPYTVIYSLGRPICIDLQGTARILGPGRIEFEKLFRLAL